MLARSLPPDLGLPAVPPGLLAAVWREVSRHLELDRSVRALFARLAEHAPATALLVRRVEPDPCRLETAAAAGPASADLPRTTTPEPADGERLARWLAAAGVSRWRADERDALGRAILPVAGLAYAAPIRGESDALLGVLVVAFADEIPGAAALVGALREPVATALANDARLCELARLREAAEADRSALLTRLQRADVSAAIVGAETGLRAVMDRVRQVARTDAPVLILGETGSGKEVVARAIHDGSPRAGRPFLRVNCGAIPPELVDSELFGHEKGSFTGAVSARKGWFERADGGTLFLDEIGELTPAAQVRLLRVLQDGTFHRVGAAGATTVDVRIVAATHRDLHAHVRDGRFREDLWYRVAVFPIHLPPLRERAGDIPALVAHFAAGAGQRLFGRPLVADPAELELLRRYAWPGNVRELAAVVERAAILGGGRRLDLASALGGLPSAPRAEPDGERHRILAALEASRGRIEGPFGAARALGVNAHTLRSRMRRLGIDWQRFRR